MVTIIGGGLAGAEAAFQAKRAGSEVTLHEMKPVKFSPAHRLEGLSELVCSNSLKAASIENSSGLLKEEMRRMGSLAIEAAYATRVPAGGALAVDRVRFSEYITERLEDAGVRVVREELTTIPAQRPLVIATGPLTSDAFAASIEEFLGRESLSFYDAVSPVVYRESIDMTKAFRGSRYDKDADDYINCPMNEEEYTAFVGELTRAVTTGIRDFEEAKYFEGCLPVEVMAGRGVMTLAFGPLKPVGFTYPGTDERPYAVVQLRRENREDTLYNMVGFQTRLTYGEQKRVFSLIAGLEQVEFARLGKVHRNSYINSPGLIGADMALIKEPSLFFAGQITGVEGYMESAASGLIAGINAARSAAGLPLVTPPPSTMMGALFGYISDDNKNFQPMNANFGLLPTIKAPRKARKKLYAERALEELEAWRESVSTA